MSKFAAFLLTAFLLMGLSLSASAAEAPDPNRECSLTLEMKWGSKPLDSGSLTLYRVGEIASEGGDVFFAPIPQLKSAVPSFGDLKDTVLPARLAELAVSNNLEALESPIRKGKAVFEKLLPGLYVVTQPETEACEGFEPIGPFLISLPQWNGVAYVYDLEAKPKVGLEQTPTEPEETEPTAPDGSRLPQTGQLNWPVPVMAAAGVTLILLGWLLCSGGKARHEK